jgi:GntP family gluconate:H+ symporter
MFLPIAAISPAVWPFVILALCVAAVIATISWLRMPAFLALILAALLAGVMAVQLPGAKPRGAGSELVLDAATGKPLKNHWVRAVELTTEEFGKTAGAVGIVIGLASIISLCLMESGAADKVVRRFLDVFGEKRAGVAILVSSYVLSIPIFFDTMFMLMVPLAMALALRTGRDYMLYVLAICCGAVVTHSLTVPHPGPLAAVENLKVDVGFSILAGIIVGIPAAGAGWVVSKWINHRMPVPLRERPGMQLSDLHAIVNKPESELPGFVVSILPVILPVVLIGIASILDVTLRSPDAGWAKFTGALFGGAANGASLQPVIEFIGNKNIALLIGTILSLVLLARHKRLSFAQVGTLLEAPLTTAGAIVLITSAGGAFGLMLKNAGVGEAIKAAAAGREINLILLSYGVALVLRIAQGSATVAMLTTSAMIYPIMTSGSGLPFNSIYVYLAVAFGSFACSWMNDSGFWVVSKLSGFTERETLKSWTVVLTVMSLTGMLATLVLSTVLPLR